MQGITQQNRQLVRQNFKKFILKKLPKNNYVNLEAYVQKQENRIYDQILKYKDSHDLSQKYKELLEKLKEAIVQQITTGISFDIYIQFLDDTSKIINVNEFTNVLTKFKNRKTQFEQLKQQCQNNKESQEYKKHSQNLEKIRQNITYLTKLKQMFQLYQTNDIAMFIQKNKIYDYLSQPFYKELYKKFASIKVKDTPKRIQMTQTIRQVSRICYPRSQATISDINQLMLNLQSPKIVQSKACLEKIVNAFECPFDPSVIEDADLQKGNSGKRKAQYDLIPPQQQKKVFIRPKQNFKDKISDQDWQNIQKDLAHFSHDKRISLHNNLKNILMDPKDKFQIMHIPSKQRGHLKIKFSSLIDEFQLRVQLELTIINGQPQFIIDNSNYKDDLQKKYQNYISKKSKNGQIIFPTLQQFVKSWRVFCKNKSGNLNQIR